MTPIAAANGAYVIDIAVWGERGGKVVEVFLDSDKGLSTGTCAAISREFSTALKNGNVLAGNYQLVVSSPGIERPLKFPRQYAKHVGRVLRVTRRVDGSQKVIDGVLTEVREDGIDLKVHNRDAAAVRFDEIIEAMVLPAW